MPTLGPGRDITSRHVAVSRSWIVPSQLAEARRVPSGLKATLAPTDAKVAIQGRIPLKRIVLAVAVAVLLAPQSFAGTWIRSLADAQKKAKA